MVLACRHAASVKGAVELKWKKLVLDNWLCRSIADFFIFIYILFPFVTGKLIWEIFLHLLYVFVFLGNCFFFVIVGL